MNNFILGGILIGIGTILLLLLTGYISGMNSMLDTVFIKHDDFQYRWKTLWLSTFLIIGILYSRNKKIETLPITFLTFISFFILAFGVRMAQGCTSGHGINGLARLSKRSFISVLVFFSTALIIASNINILKITHTKSIYPNILLPLVLVFCWVFYAYIKTNKKDEDKKINYWNTLSVILSASLFGVGLIYSGMYKFSIVKQFLNIKHKKWNCGLFLVFASAVIVSLIGYQFIIKIRKQPIIKTCEQTYILNQNCKFILPNRNKINSKLIIGSVLFGIGWGLTGMCPSTFPIRLGLGDPSAYLALISIYLGYKSEYNFEKIRIVGENNEIIFHQFYDKASFSFTYIVGDISTGEVVIIDSVYNKYNYDIPTHKIIGNLYYCDEDLSTDKAIMKFCKMKNYKVKYLINTHIHVDHITSNFEIKKNKYIQSIIGNYYDNDSDLKFEEFENIQISNNLKLDILKTPGHTKNCHSLILKNKHKNLIFTGDALLITGIGRTDLDYKDTKEKIYENKKVLFKSLVKIVKQLDVLGLNTEIYPAHDYTERTTTNYREILKINPFIKMVKEYIDTNDEKIEEKFINFFTKKELSLAKFYDYDINLCVDINKKCGVVDNITEIELDKLWSKSSGACG
jgi:glyoxylase-like metal-dependent hydrolase (beta-lactamase superfamily II)/uncharacterized membrane protein YedE/YeeE